MPNIDIPIPESLRNAMAQPLCADIKLPSPGSMQLTLPSGGSLKAIADITKGIPDDCSLSFSLLMQLGPILASLDCIFKLLKLVSSLKDIITNLPIPPVEAITKFSQAAADLAPCFLIPTPANMIPFVRDILKLVAKVLKCVTQQLESVVGMLAGIQLQMQQAEGNAELTAALDCARENAMQAAAHTMSAVEPITAILGMIQPFMDIAQVSPITIPTFAGAGDVQAMQQSVESLKQVVDAISTIADAM
jgi:hypothetical protein